MQRRHAFSRVRVGGRLIATVADTSPIPIPALLSGGNAVPRMISRSIGTKFAIELGHGYLFTVIFPPFGGLKETHAMKPEPDFYALRESAPVLPEQELWRAVIHRAVLDVQYGSEGQAKNVLNWSDTDDFDRVLTWTGLDVDPRRAAKALREVFAARLDDSKQVQACAEPPPHEDIEPPPDFPLALILAVRDIERTRRRARGRELSRTPRWPNQPAVQSPESSFDEGAEAAMESFLDCQGRSDLLDPSDAWESAASGEAD